MVVEATNPGGRRPILLASEPLGLEDTRACPAADTARRSEGTSPLVSLRSRTDASRSLELPPPRLRAGGRAWHDDAFYRSVTRQDVERLAVHAGLDPRSRVLDLGCGSGRLALGLIERFGGRGSYLGIDVRRDCIDWAREHIQARHGSFRFMRVDAPNQRYNPTGKVAFDPSRIAPADVVNAWSFFTHQSEDDASRYLRAFAALLEPEGRAHVTVLIDGGPGAPGVRYSRKPLLRVAYANGRWRELVREAGLRVLKAWYGVLPGGQSAFILGRVT